MFAQVKFKNERSDSVRTPGVNSLSYTNTNHANSNESEGIEHNHHTPEL